MDHVDPPDLALWPTLRRLFPLWWEQRRLVGVALAFALAFTGLSITIPILVQRLIDEAIVGPHEGRLLPYLGAIVLLDPLLKELARVELGHVGIVKVAPERSDASSESISRIRAEMYVETMKFVMPAA